MPNASPNAHNSGSPTAPIGAQPLFVSHFARSLLEGVVSGAERTRWFPKGIGYDGSRPGNGRSRRSGRRCIPPQRDLGETIRAPKTWRFSVLRGLCPGVWRRCRIQDRTRTPSEQNWYPVSSSASGCTRPAVLLDSDAHPRWKVERGSRSVRPFGRGTSGFTSDLAASLAHLASVLNLPGGTTGEMARSVDTSPR